MKISVEKLYTMDGHRDCVYGLEKSDNHRVFFSSAGDGMIATWDLHDPENGKLMANMKNSVYAIHFIPESNILIAGQNFEGIHFIDVANGKETASVKISNAQIFDIKSHGNRLFVASADGTLYVLDMESKAFIKKIRLSDKSIRVMAINEKLGEIALGLSDNSIRILDLDSLGPKFLINAHKLSVFALAYHPKTNALISGSRDAHLKFWSPENQYKMSDSIVAHMYAINDIAISPQHDFFITCSMDKTIKVWNIEDYKLLKVIDRSRYAGHTTSINKIKWIGDEGMFISCSDDKKVSVWRVKKDGDSQ